MTRSRSVGVVVGNPKPRSRTLTVATTVGVGGSTKELASQPKLLEQAYFGVEPGTPTPG